VGEQRLSFKFGVQVNHGTSQPTDHKQSLKVAWSRHVTHLKQESCTHRAQTSAEHGNLEDPDFGLWTPGSKA